MTENYNKCFEKHSFEELNNIDIQIHHMALKYMFNRFKISKQLIDKQQFFDIGCNSGSFVKSLSAFNIKNNIHCFEPHPVLSKKTKEVYPYIKMNEFCLSNNNNELVLNVPTWSVGLSSVIERPVFTSLHDKGQEINKLTVQCKTVDEYCEKNDIKNIFFMKIDVEGAEKLVLDGASNMLKNKKIIGGLFEVGETLKDANTSESEICNLLESHGYKIVKNLFPSDYIFHL